MEVWHVHHESCTVPGRCRLPQCSRLVPSVCSLLSALIDNFPHTLHLSSVALLLLYANVRHHLAYCWLDVTLLSYISKKCWWTSAAENVLDHKCTYIATSRISKPQMFPTCVAILNCCSCAHIAHVSRITWPWIVQPAVIYTYSKARCHIYV
jgi:hypothetical protein